MDSDAPPAVLEPAFGDALLSRIEDASLNASAPPEQRWLDGWLVRHSDGKARRARSINAVALGRLPLDEKLRLAGAVYAAAGLPMLFRMTPFSEPADLDASLAELGYCRLDETRVMVCTRLPEYRSEPLRSGTRWVSLGPSDFAHTVGALRGSSASQCAAHAQRLAVAPVPHAAWAIQRDRDGAILACGQYAREAELVGLYDIHTAESVRRQGWAQLMCERLLSWAAKDGASVAYLQVEFDNDAARRIYTRLGFSDGYAYHYRQRF